MTQAVKRLVVCCDGTWNTPDEATKKVARPTNVTKLALSVLPRDEHGTEQRAYYHPGVGTSRRDHLSGGAFGVGLSANVLDAYLFLVDNYTDGDELWLFGFSRGAYTARSVAGLIRNCGILRHENRDRVHEAYALYRARAESPRGTASTLFRNAYSYEPRIRFIGVWDTVGALGIPEPPTKIGQVVFTRLNRRWSFHDTDLSTHVDAAFHALAIDERREAFKPTLWSQQEGAGSQHLEQVWFPGVHSDVGGGYPEAGLSDVAFRWMIDKARSFDLAIVEPPARFGPPVDVDPGQSAVVDIAADPLAELHDSRTGVYKLAAPYLRPVGRQGHGSERISTAASLRHTELGYAPSNLVDAIDRHVAIDGPGT
jgi:uncharacterized protein (DUF2235 family)